MPSLFNSLSIGRTALAANQAGLEVAGNNVANAATEGYSRQRVDFVPAPSRNLGYAQLGSGVFLSSVRRIVDTTVETALRGSTSDFEALRAQTDALERLESLLQAANALENAFGPDPTTSGATDLGTRLSRFFGALQGLSFNPDDGALRTNVVEAGRALAQSANQVAQSLSDYRDQLDQLVQSDVREINQLLEQVARLNTQIVTSENGGANTGQANDLRDRRGVVLLELAKQLDIRVVETAQGAANVFLGGETLVFNDDFSRLTTRPVNLGSAQVSHVELETSGADVRPRGGALAGHLEARDEIVPEYQRRLDEFVRVFAFEFNKIHSEGSGLQRHTRLESVVGLAPSQVRQVPISTAAKVTGASGKNFLVAADLVALGAAVQTVAGAAPYVGLQVLVTSGANAGERRTVSDFDLGTGRVSFDREFAQTFTPGDAFEITGLPFPIKDGAFELRLHNENTGTINTVLVPVDRDGLQDAQSDPTLEGLVNAINTAVRTQLNLGTSEASPLVASVGAGNRLRFDIADDDFTFSFGKDSSDLLAAFGLNTFFTGIDARTIGINRLVENPNFLATSATGFPGDNTNVRGLAALETQGLYHGDAETAHEFFIGIVSTLAARAEESRDLTVNQEVLRQQLANQRERISGVNVDEEAIAMITYQRGFQAAARFIAIVDQLLAALINATL